MSQVTKLDEYASAKRDARIVELRAQRVPFREIAAELNISGPRVYQLWKRILQEIPGQHLDAYREEARQLADDAIRDLLTIAKNPNKPDSSRIRAWEVANKWSIQMSQLNGEYAPVKRELEITDTTGLEYQLQVSIAETERELKVARALTIDYTVTDDGQ